MTKIDRLAEIVGGKTVIANMCGVDNSLINRWNERYDGELPVKYRARVLAGLREAVEARDVADSDALLAEAVGLLPEAICPTCGSPLEGRVV